MQLSSHSKTLSFEKWHGAGNDFILIRDADFDTSLVPSLCHRRYGIGADGVIVLDKPNLMHIYNADGSEAPMCGNALRISAKATGWSQIQSKTHLHNVKGDWVSLAKPKWLGDDPIVIDSGARHVVCFDRNFSDAPALREEHAANVNMAVVESEDTIALRTFEKGVEAETFSCGTGAVATAFATMRTFGYKGPFTLKFASDILHVAFEDGVPWLSGHVACVFKGQNTF